MSRSRIAANGSSALASARGTRGRQQRVLQVWTVHHVVEHAQPADVDGAVDPVHVGVVQLEALPEEAHDLLRAVGRDL